LAVFLQRAGEDGIRRGHHSRRSASVPEENLGVEPSEREHVVCRHAELRGRDSPFNGGSLRRHIRADSLCTWIAAAGRHDVVELVQVVHPGEARPDILPQRYRIEVGLLSLHTVRLGGDYL